jgi:GNAT superfamily N-acetyltransferase
MVLKPIPQPPAAAPGVTTSRVDGSNYDDFIQALVDMGMPPEFARSAFGEATLAAPDVELFVAYLDGRPVGNSVLVRSGDVSGVYSVAVVDSARRRGVGSAVTWAAIDHARGWDSEAVFLQSTEQGYGVYSAMGFRTIVEYAWFALPRPDDTPTRE